MALSVSDDAKITEDTNQFLRETCWVVIAAASALAAAAASHSLKDATSAVASSLQAARRRTSVVPWAASWTPASACAASRTASSLQSSFDSDFATSSALEARPLRQQTGIRWTSRPSLRHSGATTAAAEGLGLTGKVMNPMISGQSKLCCCFSKHFTTDCCGPRGCISINQKTFCCAMYKQCPPTLTPGIGCCNMMICGDSRETYARNAPVQQRM
eukprot:CAMPEP_0194752006 /NCGR_PEP_ID=MMETSP0323_2-20130528/5884_1 /TAXON_ID=2866 ORGANISM="Crypthecodinium cohnii, Strain Seligo" /NCGR_SAMPLE_ID=MMETSP0323_2 /ASSEMBLY_ACC=CAM_ASM_000346 /LENGTH=214 /DNA_ID=CAMNT_0039668711 /DNA_START=226 /DNA_END=870 /DNA_ORIENTATION=+